MGCSGFLWFVSTALLDIFSKIPIEICWDAGILVVICYGFAVVSLNRFNIHTENLEKT